ncbi:uncharacterized protein LOC100185997 [Ciona intestinalis]
MANDSGASMTFPMQCSALRKNGHVMIKGHAVKIVDMSTSKTGKHGHAKVHMVGIDIFDSKKYEDISPSTHNMQVPNIKRTEVQVIDIDIDDQQVTIMDDDGTTRELKVDDKTILDNIKKSVDAGSDCFVTILAALGREKVITTKEKNDD